MSTPTDKSAKPEMHGHSAFPAATSLVGVYGEQLFRILEQTSSGYIVLDSQNRAQRWNDGYLQLFPWLAPALKVGAPLITTLQAAAASAPAASIQTLSHIAENHHSLITRKQASIKLLLPSGRKVSLSAHALSASYTVLACKELLDAEDSGEGLAFFDTLTNLPNRRLLLDRLSQAMIQSERTGWRGALLTIDMQATGAQSKDFLRESQAHLAQLISQRLLSCVRACDTVARLDKQHFVIMVSDLSPDIELTNLLVERLGERLQESLNAYYQVDDRNVTLEANIGATLFGPHSRSATELLQQAEMAMYRLRDGEPRGLHFFDPKQQIQTPDRNRMELDLREALRLGQFELHYQPQYSTRGDISSLEALLRWRHPSRGLVPPSIFLSIAEETDIIVPLGHWTVQTACEQLAKWEADPLLCNHPICVNISTKQLQQPDFAEQVEGIITHTGINPAFLWLEMSTRSLSTMSVAASRSLTRLSALGVRLSIDDFGGSCSTPEILRQLPLQQIKLAHSLVQRLGPNNSSEAAIQVAITMAAQQQIAVVGAGVETLEQRALLAQHGCNHFMGYLFNAPVPADQLKSLLQKSALFAPQKHVA